MRSRGPPGQGPPTTNAPDLAGCSEQIPSSDFSLPFLTLFVPLVAHGGDEKSGEPAGSAIQPRPAGSLYSDPDDPYRVADVIPWQEAYDWCSPCHCIIIGYCHLLLPLLPLLPLFPLFPLLSFVVVFAVVLVKFEVQRDVFFQRSVCRGTTDMHAVFSVNSSPLAISPVRQVVRFFRNEIRERVVGVSMVNTHSHLLALTWLKVNLLEVNKTLSRLPCLVR